jgi:hypothetical protein
VTAPPLTISSDGYNDRATAKLLGAALGGDSSDIEMASTGIAAAFEPSWIVRTEKIKGEMAVLKERMNKLKEWVLTHPGSGHAMCSAAAGVSAGQSAVPCRRHHGSSTAAQPRAPGRPASLHTPLRCRYHAKSLLVTFDDNNSGASAHVDALTREVKASFKRLDQAVRGMDQGQDAGSEDAQVRLAPPSNRLPAVTPGRPGVHAQPPPCHGSTQQEGRACLAGAGAAAGAAAAGASPVQAECGFQVGSRHRSFPSAPLRRFAAAVQLCPAWQQPEAWCAACRKEETRFLNKIEQQKGLAKGSSIGLIEDDNVGSGTASTDPGFTEAQLQKVGCQQPCAHAPPSCSAGGNRRPAGMLVMGLPAKPCRQRVICVLILSRVVFSAGVSSGNHDRGAR